MEQAIIIDRPRRTYAKPLLWLVSLLIILVILFVPWWLLHVFHGAITFWQASKVKTKMTMAEVRELVGEPILIEKLRSEPPIPVWYYRVGDGLVEQRTLIVTFELGQDSVAEAEIVSSLYFAPARW